MKNFKSTIGHIALLSLMLSVVAGCDADKEIVTDPEAGHELTFRAHVGAPPQTRVADTNWDSGDMIGVFMTDETGATTLEANNRYVTTSSEGVFNALELSDRIFLPDDLPVDLWAYYPHDPAASNFEVPVDITDQSDQSGLDLLRATLDDVGSFATPPTFTFSRQMTRLMFNVTAGQGISSLSGLEVAVSEVPTLATFDVKSGAMDIDNNSVAPFEGKVTVSGRTARVEITMLPGSQPTVTFTLEGDPFVWEADRTFAGGNRHTYSLTLTDRSVVVIPSNGYFDTPVLPEGGVPGQKPSGSAATKYLTFPGTDLIYYEVDFPDRQGRNYQMLYDSKELIAYWVAYPMYSSIMSTGNRTDDWAYDPNIEQSLQQNLARSYGGGYDRGHQMPSADRNYNTTVNRTTFYYTNMTPQVSSMNQGIWSQLEGGSGSVGVRKWAKQCDTLYVVTGASLTTLTDNVINHVSDNNGKQVGLPKYYYKALAQRDNNGTPDPSDDIFHTAAFKIDNAAVPGTFNDYRITVAQLEQETGFTFFPQLPDPSVKNTVDPTVWQ